MLALKIVKIGDATGLVLPKEALAKLRVGPGDTVLLSETPDANMRPAATQAPPTLRRCAG